ncbi:MalM family protein [Kushneria phosphatilytica]|uniref:Uncharacterized protein n=1 Tax=Kushneria phosphatilytica TaxID=657387 RepID=A0A1S1NUV7_9GAMM|nr:MalM family protein [Kushneria phosphatilytica]OHV08666.1 hypothetical protein BH688_11555 [Kushneria phosphatilytica]QEL12383.1 hypothetical protein FY550_15380 [Kushneria phosphatilytica]
MKRTPLTLLTTTLVIGLAGCSSMSAQTASSAQMSRGGQALLSQTSDCCSTLAGLPYQSLQSGQSRTLTFNADTPAHQFSDGKSFFHAFALPDSRQPLVLQVTSPIDQQQVFAPSLLLLDNNFQPVERVGSDQLTYQGPNGFRDSRLTGSFSVMPGPDAAYVVLYTSDSDRAATTTYENPEKVYARVRGLAEPALPDPVAAHTATGKMTLEVSNAAERNGLLAPLTGDAVPTPLNDTRPRSAAPTATAGSTGMRSSSAAAPSQQNAPAQQALDYRRMIRAALKAGDIELAMQLADRAESAGQTGTRAWLAKQLKTATP